MKLFACFFFFLLSQAIGYTIIYTIILQQDVGKLEERGRGSNEYRIYDNNNTNNFLCSRIKEANI